MIWSSLLAAQGLCSKPSLNNSCWLNSLQGLLPDTFRKYGHLTALSCFLSLPFLPPPPCPCLVFHFIFYFIHFILFHSFFFVPCFLTCANYVSYLQVLASISALAPLSTALSIWRLLQPSHITSSGVCFQLWKAVSTTPSSHPPTAASLSVVFFFLLFPPLTLLLSQLLSRARKQEEETQQNTITS